MKRLPSLRQLQASRKNGAKSRGPVTAEGKQKASLNALSHGLTAKTVVLPHENADRFEALLQGLAAEHAPATLTEQLLLEHAAVAAWRIRRNFGFEKALFAMEMAQKSVQSGAHDQAALAWADSPRLLLSSRYETSQHRLFRSNLHDLFLAQQLRGGDPGEIVEIDEVADNEGDTFGAAALRNEPEASHGSPHPEGPLA